MIYDNPEQASATTEISSDQATPSWFRHIRNRINRAITSEDGTAAFDFVLVIPLIMGIFMASMESGLLMTRFILLEQSVDMTMRNLRLGQYPNPDVPLLKAEICRRAIIMEDCENNISIDLQPVSTTSWTFPPRNAGCVDRGAALQPATTFNPGAAHQIMMVRVCVTQDAMFPTTGIGLALPKDDQGGYGLVAISAFVNEP